MSENAPSELTDHVIVYHPIIIIHPEITCLRLESRCVNTYRKYKLHDIYPLSTPTTDTEGSNNDRHRLTDTLSMRDI